jgi:hypothetical protein
MTECSSPAGRLANVPLVTLDAATVLIPVVALAVLLCSAVASFVATAPPTTEVANPQSLPRAELRPVRANESAPLGADSPLGYGI